VYNAHDCCECEVDDDDDDDDDDSFLFLVLFFLSKSNLFVRMGFEWMKFGILFVCVLVCLAI